ncbi:MaoC family dehydratase [Patulibacter minatonensis]|uniref:MaoC family dehydratase n=1 Tax=Patulibacter minatonensis TaxID=298163 RepID=UPI00047BD7E5|nr:MaoC/PaaZ C-terminal domain-containing protein [Patulibacter minatonensis]
MTVTRELKSIPKAAPLYGRAALPMLPFASRLPFVAGSTKEIPDVDLVVPEVRVDAKNLAAYREVTGFLQQDRLPVTYGFALAFPLHMALMTGGDFPFPAVGLVHLRNRIVHHRPIAPDEALRVSVHGSPLQPHPKGRTFVVRTELSVGTEVVWTCESTFFKRGKGDGSKDDAPDPIDAVAVDLATLQTTQWELPEDLGRRFARIGGDINPIHLHPLTAKAFGFPRHIAHGMWTKARSLAAIEDLLPDAYAVEVRFQKPVFLPGTVEFGSVQADDGRIGFALQDAKKQVPHLRGLVSPS